MPADATAALTHGLWTEVGEVVDNLIYITDIEVNVEIEEYDIEVELEKE